MSVGAIIAIVGGILGVGFAVYLGVKAHAAKAKEKS